MDFSDLKLERKECPKCGAVWLNGQLRWATGQVGNDLDLAGLVCNERGDETCINPDKGLVNSTQQTWEKRVEFLNGLSAEMDDKGML